MKYPTLILVNILVGLGQVHAQTDLTMTRDEFVESQLNMMEQAKVIQQEMASRSDDMMKDKMSAEAYTEYKQDTERKQKQQEREVANCLGIPPENMAELSARVGPDFQITVIKKCSGKLPPTINLEGLDWTSNKDFLEYKRCAEALVAKEVGVPADRLEECSRMAQNF